MHGEGRIKIISSCALFNSPVIFTEVSTHMRNVLPFKNQRKQAQQLKRMKSPLSHSHNRKCLKY